MIPAIPEPKILENGPEPEFRPEFFRNFEPRLYKRNVFLRKNGSGEAAQKKKLLLYLSAMYNQNKVNKIDDIRIRPIRL
jgi:hypothetical protein